MKFKILKGTEMFNKLNDLFERGYKCNAAADKLCKELGGKSVYRSSGSRDYFGGICAINFDSKPDGWKVMGAEWQNLFMPKANMKELWKKIKALPVITYGEVNNLVGFRGPQAVSSDTGIAWVTGVSLFKGKDYFLMAMTEGVNYKPPSKDIVEIKVSEFQKLLVPITHELL